MVYFWNFSWNIFRLPLTTGDLKPWKVKPPIRKDYCNLILSDSKISKSQKYKVIHLFKNDNASYRDAYFRPIYTECDLNLCSFTH